MKSAAILVSLISSIAFVAAVPAQLVERNMFRGDAQAAAYFLTNQPTGNNIVVAALTSDGHVSYKHAMSTRGLGAHVTGSTAADPLMSQGAIQASVSGQILAAVNAGSSTVSLFSINPSDPTVIQQIGEPVSSEGEFPVAVTINKKGDQVCVLNAGQVNGVHCYTVDKTLGLIRQAGTLRYLNVVRDPGPMTSAAHHIAFNDANDKLIVTVVGTPNYLAIWDVASNGTLSDNFTTVSPPSGGMNPFSLTPIPGKNAMVSADTAVGADVWDLSALSAQSNQTAAGKSASVSIGGQMANCWSTYSQKTGNFYFIDAGASIVTEVNVDQNLKGTVVKQYPQGTGSTTLDAAVATVGNTDFLYVLAANKTSIDVVSLDGPGNGKNVGSYDFSAMVKAMGIPVNATWVQGMTTFSSA